MRTKGKALLRDEDAPTLILMSTWLIVMSLLSIATYWFGANVVTMTLLAGVLITFGWLFSRNLERGSLLSSATGRVPVPPGSWGTWEHTQALVVWSLSSRRAVSTEQASSQQRVASRKEVLVGRSA
jgi:hypothetical protein